MKQLSILLLLITVYSCINQKDVKYQKLKLTARSHYKICNNVLDTCKKYKTKKQFNKIVTRIINSGISEYYTVYKSKR